MCGELQVTSTQVSRRGQCSDVSYKELPSIKLLSSPVKSLELIQAQAKVSFAVRNMAFLKFLILRM
jgi:hypothetical protein